MSEEKERKRGERGYSNACARLNSSSVAVNDTPSYTAARERELGDESTRLDRVPSARSVPCQFQLRLERRSRARVVSEPSRIDPDRDHQDNVMCE